MKFKSRFSTRVDFQSHNCVKVDGADYVRVIASVSSSQMPLQHRCKHSIFAMTIVNMCFSFQLLYMGIGVSLAGHFHPSVDASDFGTYIFDDVPQFGDGTDVHYNVMSRRSIDDDVNCTVFDTAQTSCSPLQENPWQDLVGPLSFEARNFAKKNFACIMPKKNFATAKKYDETATQPAEDGDWARLRPEYPGLVWTRLHETAWQIHALPKDEKVIDISVKEVATLVVVHTKTDRPGDRKFSAKEDQPEAVSAQVPKKED